MVATPTAKGIRRVDATEAMQAPMQISNVADDADSLINYTVPTAADLPGVNNWIGRIIYVQEYNSLRLWTGSAWIVISEAHLRRLDSTKTSVVAREQSGFGKITGDNTSAITELLNFPVAFASIPVVVMNNIGYRATGAYDIAGLGTANPLVCAATSTTASGTTVTMQSPSGGALSSVNDYYFNWYAIGTTA